MSDEIKVRIGTLDDLDSMMKIAMMATDENAFCAPNPLKLLADIYPALQQDRGIVGIIGDVGGEIEGAVLLRVGSIWYSDMPLLEEKAVFVHPDYRAAKGGRATRLCEFSKLAADMLGMPLTIGVLSDHRTRAKVKMYTRVMGEPSGCYWLYNATTGHHTEGNA